MHNFTALQTLIFIKEFKMRTFSIIRIPVLLSLSLLISLSSCKKKNDPVEPVASTTVAKWVGQKWATMVGVVNPNGSEVNSYLEYGLTTDYGSSLEASPFTSTGSSAVFVYGYLNGLTPGTKYHYRLKTVCSLGTFYGGDTTFTTTNPSKSTINFNTGLTYGTMTDGEDNVYKTIVIGTQTWMAENLAVTKLNDGTPLTFLTSDTFWADSAVAAYCWYNNDSIVYGALYNFYAVSTGKLCPAGWHVPSNSEWSTLTTYLGGESDAAPKLMEAGNSHWQEPNVSQTDDYGFTAIPGGYRKYSGGFGNQLKAAYWWSGTESSADNGWFRYIYFSFNNINTSNTQKATGMNVRCIKD